ncbi:MAG: hypothetical protein M1820_009926 [Bogoriella megaspora]|nr:MAG: hypothetical protein M1820_009926 [Bogoriella megaspora]
MADCSTQAAGTCLFNLRANQPALTDLEYSCTLYDNNCSPISDTEDVCNPGTALDSTLPYTVDVKSRSNTGNAIAANIAYGAGTYSRDNSGFTTDDCSNGLDGCSDLYLQFPY